MKSAIHAICLCTFFFASGITVASDIDKISREGASRAGLVSALEFNSVISIADSEEEEIIRTTKGSIVYYYKGHKHRVETLARIESDNENSTINTIAAYDGNRYQVFLPNENTLSLKNSSQIPNPSQVPNPLVLPYAFLFKYGMTYTWDGVTSVDNWKRALKNADYKGVKTENEMDYEVFDVSIPGGMIYEVWLAKEYGYYPFKTILYLKEHKIGAVVVDSWSEHEIDGQPVVVPSKVIASMLMRGVQSDGDFSIEPGTVKVNHDLPEDLFQLSPTKTTTIYDVDKMKQATSDETSDHKHEKRP